MKYTVQFLLLIFILVSIPVVCFSETIQLGLNYGSSIINWSNYMSISIDGQGYVSVGDLYTPKCLSFSFGIKLPFGMMLRPAIGYGQTSSTEEVDRPGTAFSYTDYDNNVYEAKINQYYKREKAQINGLSIDFSFLYPVYVDANKKLLIYPGIGIGYNYYNYSGEYKLEWTEVDYADKKDSYSASGDFPEAKLSGICQTFILGIEIRPAKWLGLSMEFIKMGFNAISEEYDQVYIDFDERNNEYSQIVSKKIGTEKNDYIAGNGLTDIAVIFGTKINL